MLPDILHVLCREMMTIEEWIVYLKLLKLTLMIGFLLHANNIILLQ